MGYILDAWLEEGAPRLRLINPENGTTTLTWDCPTLDKQDDADYRKEMQNLFKKLILIASAQDNLREQLNTTKEQSEYERLANAY